jgi:phospholipid transport system transporter-binding protein
MAEHIIAPHGTLTMVSAGKAFRDIEKIPAEITVHIDLSGVEQIDSSAVALLVTALQTARLKGQTVRLQPIPRHIMQFAEIYGLGEALSRQA